jgi:hypothetical protein
MSVRVHLLPAGSWRTTVGPSRGLGIGDWGPDRKIRVNLSLIYICRTRHFTKGVFSLFEPFWARLASTIYKEVSKRANQIYFLMKFGWNIKNTHV